MYSTKKTYRCPYSPSSAKAAVFAEFSAGKFPSELVKDKRFKLTWKTLLQYWYLWRKSTEYRNEVLRVLAAKAQAGRVRLQKSRERELFDDLTKDLLAFVAKFPLTFFRPGKEIETLLPALVERWSNTIGFRKEFYVSNVDPRTGELVFEKFASYMST